MNLLLLGIDSISVLSACATADYAVLPDFIHKRDMARTEGRVSEKTGASAKPCKCNTLGEPVCELFAQTKGSGALSLMSALLG